MKDQQVSSHNLQEFFAELQAEIEQHKLVIVSSQPAGTGKWGMARLWRAWMKTTGDSMASHGVTMPLMVISKYPKNSNLIDKAIANLRSLLGRGQNFAITYGTRPFNENDAHELFTRQHLGVDESGNRISWAKSGDKRKATKGERFNALRKHEQWCCDRGIVLFKPRGSEYDQLEQEQEK